MNITINQASLNVPSEPLHHILTLNMQVLHQESHIRMLLDIAFI